jgi:hypothetical protein
MSKEKSIPTSIIGIGTGLVGAALLSACSSPETQTPDTAANPDIAGTAAAVFSTEISAAQGTASDDVKMEELVATNSALSTQIAQLASTETPTPSSAPTERGTVPPSPTVEVFPTSVPEPLDAIPFISGSGVPEIFSVTEGQGGGAALESTPVPQEIIYMSDAIAQVEAEANTGEVTPALKGIDQEHIANKVIEINPRELPVFLYDDQEENLKNEVNEEDFQAAVDKAKNSVLAEIDNVFAPEEKCIIIAVTKDGSQPGWNRCYKLEVPGELLDDDRIEFTTNFMVQYEASDSREPENPLTFKLTQFVNPHALFAHRVLENLGLNPDVYKLIYKLDNDVNWYWDGIGQFIKTAEAYTGADAQQIQSTLIFHNASDTITYVVTTDPARFTVDGNSFGTVAIGPTVKSCADCDGFTNVTEHGVQLPPDWSAAAELPDMNTEPISPNQVMVPTDPDSLEVIKVTVVLPPGANGRIHWGTGILDQVQ